MRKIYTILILGFFVTININSFAQCTPDPTCTDVLNPGEICPEILPDGTVGVPYNQVVTVIPPPTASIAPYGSVTIKKIVLTGVDNLPPGLSYQCNPANCYFTVTSPTNTKYCINISGTPTTAGVYPLSIHIVPYIMLGIEIPTPEQVDDTSLAITINPQTTGYSVISMNKFSILESTPNPFSYSSKIGCISPATGELKLTVFDVIGNLIYQETMAASRGENYFKFDGIKLNKGMYFYTVTNGKESATKQLIKN